MTHRMRRALVVGWLLLAHCACATRERPPAQPLSGTCSVDGDRLRVVMRNAGTEPLLLWVGRGEPPRQGRPYAYYVGDGTLVLYYALVRKPDSIFEAFPSGGGYLEPLGSGGTLGFDLPLSELPTQDDAAYRPAYAPGLNEREAAVRQVVIVQGYLRSRLVPPIERVKPPDLPDDVRPRVAGAAVDLLLPGMSAEHSARAPASPEVAALLGRAYARRVADESGFNGLTVSEFQELLILGPVPLPSPLKFVVGPQ